MNSTQNSTLNTEAAEAARIAAICATNKFTYNYRSAAEVSKIRTNYRWSFTVNYNNFNFDNKTAQAFVVDTFFARTSNLTINPSGRHMGFTLTFSGVSSSKDRAYIDAGRVMHALGVA